MMSVFIAVKKLIKRTHADGAFYFFQFFKSAPAEFFIHIKGYVADLSISIKVLAEDVDFLFGKAAVNLAKHPGNVLMDV